MNTHLEPSNFFAKVISDRLIELIPQAGFRHVILLVDPAFEEIVIKWESRHACKAFYACIGVKYQPPKLPSLGSLRHAWGVNHSHLSVFKFDEFLNLKTALEKLVALRWKGHY